MEIDGNEKVFSKYNCSQCNFNTNIKCNYDKHLLSEKHKRNGELKEKRHICSVCNIEYSSNSGLWKHRKTCVQSSPIETLQNTFRHVTPLHIYNAHHVSPSTVENCPQVGSLNVQRCNNIPNFTPELFLEVMNKSKELQDFLIEQNKELQSKLLEQQNQLLQQQNKMLEKDDMLIEQNNKIIELASKPTMVNSNNNSNNKHFNLQFFLNETCKDAMNITDFINSIKLTIDDFETTGRLGFVDGISRIFVKELNKLETEKLPLHCTDFKRETVYIKNNDTWEKENDEKTRVKWAIDRVAQLNYNKVIDWQEKYPDCWVNNSRGNEKFFALVKVALGGHGKEEEDKFREKIMKNVLKEVVLDKK